MANRGKRRALASAFVVGVALGLVSVPAGQAAAAACTWQQNVWALPDGTDAGELYGYDGSRYAVGITGQRSWWGEDTIVDPHPTVWDNGQVVQHDTDQLPHLRDVNSSGLIVGDTIIDNDFVAVTVDLDGTVTVLPGDPSWDGYDAWAVNNRGDVVGLASLGVESFAMVVWPADAPGTYRVLPTPDTYYLHVVDVDEQGRIVANGADSGLVWDTDGQWHALAKAPDPTGAMTGSTRAIRDGRVVGNLGNTSNWGDAGEWDAQGRLTGRFADALSALTIGGNGTVGGVHFVGSRQHAALWRDGVIVDPLTAVPDGFDLHWLSDDEHTLVGIEDRAPTAYHCA